jgi:hypothetical protein
MPIETTATPAATIASRTIAMPLSASNQCATGPKGRLVAQPAKHTSWRRAGSAWFGWMKGGPDRWVTWGVGAIGTVLSLGGGPKENPVASAHERPSAIILWCGARWATTASLSSDEVRDRNRRVSFRTDGCAATVGLGRGRPALMRSAM